MRRPKAVGNRLHIGNRRWRRAEPKPAVARSQHRGIIVFPHHSIGHENRIQRHRHRLYHQDSQHRQRQRCQLPQLQAHQRHREEQRQANVAQHRYRALKHAIKAQQRQAVAEDHADKQDAHEGWQLKHAPRQQLRNHPPDRETDCDQGNAFNQHQRGDHPPNIRLFKSGRRYLIVR